MRKQVNPKDLVPHPENDYYFDKMKGRKWGGFKESIKENRWSELPVITPHNLIVIGHEYVRACIELGINRIEVEEREFKSDEAILTCLIETNLQLHECIGGSVINKARRIKALERCYNIRHGNNSWGVAESISTHKTQEQLASDFGMTSRNLRMIRNLADLPIEYQTMVESGKIKPTTAAKLIVGLSPHIKNELLKYLSENDEKNKKFTESQIEQYIVVIQTYM